MLIGFRVTIKSGKTEISHMDDLVEPESADVKRTYEGALTAATLRPGLAN